MTETSLKTIEWEEIMDYYLCLILGGYNSNREYYEDGKYKKDIEEKFIDIYKRNVDFVNGGSHLNSCNVEKYFVNTYGLEEDVLIESSENQFNAACVWVHNSDEYQAQREKASHFPENERNSIIDDLIEEMSVTLSETEYSSYFPHEIYAYMHFYTTRGFSFLNSEDIDNIHLVINDCQNSLCAETKMCYTNDRNKIADYEYDLIEIAKTANFIRIPKETVMIGDGR